MAGEMIRLITTLLASLSGTLLGIVLAAIRTRRRQIETNARRVSDALSDTVLVDSIELPKPENERWAMQDVDFKGRISRSLVLGPVIVTGDDIVGHSCVCVGSTPMNRIATRAEKRYAESVWRAYRNRIVRKALA